MKTETTPQTPASLRMAESETGLYKKPKRIKKWKSSVYLRKEKPKKASK